MPGAWRDGGGAGGGGLGRPEGQRSAEQAPVVHVSSAVEVVVPRRHGLTSAGSEISDGCRDGLWLYLDLDLGLCDWLGRLAERQVVGVADEDGAAADEARVHARRLHVVVERREAGRGLDAAPRPAARCRSASAAAAPPSALSAAAASQASAESARVPSAAVSRAPAAAVVVAVARAQPQARAWGAGGA